MKKVLIITVLIFSFSCIEKQTKQQEMRQIKKDKVTGLSHEDELLAASERAKDKIPELYNKFSKGLSVGSHLLIKFPFENASGEREWMWVDVVKWNEKEIIGILQNDSKFVKSLKQSVQYIFLPRSLKISVFG